MKARIPHDFFLLVQKYTLESMLKEVSFWAFDIYKNPDKDMGRFSGKRIHKSSMEKVLMIQTWLIDLVYDIIKYNRYGNDDISQQETLKLIGYYGNYKDDIGLTSDQQKDLLLYLFGFFGEQCRFQSNLFCEEFAREKYILEKISKYPEVDMYNIDFITEFEQETSFSTDMYSANLFAIFCLFINSRFVNENAISNYFNASPVNYKDIIKIVEENSISVDEIRNHPLERQSLYTNPIIKINEQYIAPNPFLILSLFANSNYWIIRNKYCNLRSQNFINAFGIYFEKYVEELLERCLNQNDYTKIPVSDIEKRADWKLRLEGFDVLVEQKSSLPVLKIKQNQPDMNAIKNHIIKCWGEAVEQLSTTEKSFHLVNSVKIILVYDEYFLDETLSELFKLRADLINDGNYWLVNIREFEMLMMLYHKNKALFKIIMDEKINAENSFSYEGKELFQFFQKHNITHNDYLTEYGIYNEAERILKYYTLEEYK